MEVTDYTLDIATLGDIDGKLSCCISNPETEWKSKSSTDGSGRDGNTIPVQLSFCGTAAPSAPTLQINLSPSVVLLAMSWTSSARSVEVHAGGNAQCTGLSLLTTVSCSDVPEGKGNEFNGEYTFPPPSAAARGSSGAVRQVKLKFFGRLAKNQWNLQSLQIRLADQGGTENQLSRQSLAASSLDNGSPKPVESLRPNSRDDAAQGHTVAVFQEALLASLQPIMANFQSFATRVEDRFDRLEARLAVVENRTEELLQAKIKSREEEA